MVSNTNDECKKCIIMSKPKKNTKNIEKYKEKVKINDSNNYNSKPIIDLNNYKSDIDKLTKLFMNVQFEHIQLYNSYIRDKTNSYLYQDKKKNRNTDNNITVEGVIEKLVTSRLKCYYCESKLVLLNEKTRQSNMWTLDRIDNNLSHTFENTCVSCLTCNLQKRRRSHEGFKFTKQLRVYKGFENEINDDNNDNK